MSNILVRTLTGAVFITVVLFPLFWRTEAVMIIFGLFMIVGLIEFYQMANKHEQVDVRWETGLLMGLFIYGIIIGTSLFLLPDVLFFVLPTLIFVFPILELWRKKANPLLNIAILWMGILYVVLPFLLMSIWHISEEKSSALAIYSPFPKLAGMFILIWMNDTFAYLSGRFFGKTKLIERISPNKTWEGTIGGILFTIAGAAVMSILFDPQNLTFWIISSLLIAPCSILGDLLESVFKRNTGVKDSGTLLPGHGGVLDRFDATLFTAPFFVSWSYIYMYF